uniref:UspA domain-containing protein n=1 Tax=Quercus lobata TaxID=97700 RepID=A0A7N2MPU5_QUELO
MAKIRVPLFLKRVRVQSVCLGRAPACSRICSLFFRTKPTSGSIIGNQKTEFSSNSRDDFSHDDPAEGFKAGSEIGNKIMVVVDSSLEAKGALEWALSNTIQTQDTIILLHVAKPSRQGSNGKGNLRAYEFLHSMKKTCQTRRPGVKVEIALLEGKEKGPIIVEEAKQQRVSLLVIGQRKKSSILWCLVKRWAGKRDHSSEVVEYCIQNASCMAIAVRRKSKKLGGFLITTKRHKNFWLLA